MRTRAWLAAQIQPWRLGELQMGVSRQVGIQIEIWNLLPVQPRVPAQGRVQAGWRALELDWPRAGVRG